MSRRIGEAELANPSNDAERSEALQRLKSMTLTDFYPRPGFGTTGRPIVVLANQFQARFKGQGKIIMHYDVEINPVVKVQNQKKPVGLMRQCWAMLESALTTPEAKSFYSAGAYDGRKNFFTPNPIAKGDSKAHEFTISLPDPDPRLGVPVEEQGRRFKIQIKHVADIDLESIQQFCAGKRQAIQNMESMLTAFMSVNVLLRSPLHLNYTASGAQERRFFTMEDHVPISNGAVVAKGFAQSFRPAIGHPAIQLDTAYSAFVAPGPLIEVAKGLLGRNNGGFRGGRGGPRGGARGGGDRGGRGVGRGGFGGPPTAPGDLQSLSQFDIQKLRKVLFGAKFKMTHRAQKKVFNFGGLTLKTAEELTFTKDDGSKQTVTQYFKTQYNITLRYPRLPCVVTGKKTYIPMELATIEPFHSLPPLKLTPDQTAEMIKVSAKPPADRRDAIMAWRKKLAWETKPAVKAWGIEIKETFTEVPARVLNAPQIAYAGGPRGITKPAGGAWNLRGKKFFKAGKPLSSWSVVSFDRFFDIPKMQGFITFLIAQMKLVGINVVNDRPPLLGPTNPQGRGVMDGLTQAAKAAYDAGGGKLAPQLIVVIMPAREVALYEEIKRSATRLNAPVPTQCLQAKKVSNDRGLDQYCANVAMKINAKLGGINVSIPLPELPGVSNKTMLVGADVGHPPQGMGPIRPSIAATVASVNGENNSFKPCVRLQEGRKEPITDMSAMITYHLKEFEKNTRGLPESIIMYRDGVSESQYAAIVEIECKAIHDAAAQIKKGYKPKLCFIICAKRHSMRFFAKNPQDNDRSGNLPAGTVVDSVVTHPYAFDFYLQAHAGLVGTARPTHLVCLRNDQNLKVDEVQRLSNALSYNFQRATRSVSIVSLAYYADLICTATRSMVYEGDGTDYEPTESGTAGGTVKSLPAEQFDPMVIMNKIEKGGNFNSVQWYM